MQLERIKSRYPFMDLELRKRLIPDRSVISTAPAIDPADDFYTGNGHYWLECAGGVEKDTFIITEEHLYEPLWKKTPEPPDLQGAMPALLLEMCVYSEPGFVEFLPSLPDLYREGKIEGVWLYTFAKLEKLEWNSEALTAVIRSNKEQTIKFMLRNRISKFFINDTTAEDGAESKDYTFRAGEKVTVRIEPCDLR